MRDAWVSRQRIEACVVGLAGADGLDHGVVDFQDDALGAVLAIFLLVMTGRVSLTESTSSWVMPERVPGSGVDLPQQHAVQSGAPGKTTLLIFLARP